MADYLRLITSTRLNPQDNYPPSINVRYAKSLTNTAVVDADVEGLEPMVKCLIGLTNLNDAINLLTTDNRFLLQNYTTFEFAFELKYRTALKVVGHPSCVSRAPFFSCGAHLTRSYHMYMVKWSFFVLSNQQKFQKVDDI